MSITVEDAIASLQAMFPSYDADTLKTLLSANSGNVERTVETIFQMESGGDVTSGLAPTPPPPQQQRRPPPQPQRPAPYSDITAPSPYTDYNDPSRVYQSYQQPPSGRAGASSYSNNNMSPSRSSSSGGNGHSSRRGINLPEDFLRPPGWRENNITLADEQLAMMLQNEMFQREAQAILGANYPQGARRARSGSASSTNNGNSNGNGSGSSSGGAGAAQDGIPDLGIVKSLSSMGESARRTLNSLALRFQASQDDKKGGKKETTGLLRHADDADEDGEEEVINFQGLGQPRRHSLDDYSSTAPPGTQGRLTLHADTSPGGMGEKWTHLASSSSSSSSPSNGHKKND